MAIIISQKGKPAVKVDRSSFEKEGHLQEYLYDNPELIPIYEIDEDIKLLIVAREFQTSSGPIDALALDKNGQLYIIETKLYKNPDKRLVVAQVLDYGAALWSHSLDFGEFTGQLNEATMKKFKLGLKEKLQQFFSLSDEEVESALNNLESNLDEGKFKFVVLMDELHDRLKDLIIFINQNSKFDLYAVELEYYNFQDYEITIPRIFGNEVKKDIHVSSSNSARRKWDEQSFFEELKNNLKTEDIGLIRRLYDFSKETADELSWGTGVNQASFSVRFNKLGTKPLFVINSAGKFYISLDYPKKEASKEQIANLDKLERFLTNIGIAVEKGANRTVFNLNEWGSKIDKMIASIKSV